jgi:hypothetical protein
MKLGTPDSMPRGESLASLSAEGEGAWEALEGGKRGWGEDPAAGRLGAGRGNLGVGQGKTGVASGGSAGLGGVKTSGESRGKIAGNDLRHSIRGPRSFRILRAFFLPTSPSPHPSPP